MLAVIARLAKYYAKLYFGLSFAFAIIAYGLPYLFFQGQLGSDCRYSGATGSMGGCTLMGTFDIDWLAGPFVGIWMLPVIGPIAGILLPFVIAAHLTIIVAVIRLIMRVFGLGSFRRTS